MIFEVLIGIGVVMVLVIVFRKRGTTAVRKTLEKFRKTGDDNPYDPTKK